MPADTLRQFQDRFGFIVLERGGRPSSEKDIIGAGLTGAVPDEMCSGENCVRFYLPETTSTTAPHGDLTNNSPRLSWAASGSASMGSLSVT